MDAPTNLKHTPIIQVKNYADRDSQYKNDTDARYLSVGFATWDNDKVILEKAISAKVWRYDNENARWKRQSEELPIHRVIDLSILILATLIKNENKDSSDSNLGETIVSSQNENFKYVYKYYQKHKDLLNPRFVELERLIKIFMKNEILQRQP